MNILRLKSAEYDFVRYGVYSRNKDSADLHQQEVDLRCSHLENRQAISLSVMILTALIDVLMIEF